MNTFNQSNNYNYNNNYNNPNNNNNLGAKTSFESLKDAFNNIGSSPTSHLAEDSLRFQLQQDAQHQQQNQNQYRVPRVSAAAHQQHHEMDIDNEIEAKKKHPPSYFYPPQPSSDSPNSLDGGAVDASLATRIKGLFNFPCSNYGKAIITIIGVEALLVIIMQIVIVVHYFSDLIDDPMAPATEGINAGISFPPSLDPRNQSRSIPAYLIVFVFAQLFQLVFAWDAVRAQNTIELIGIVLFNLCCFAYSIFEISQTKTSIFADEEVGFLKDYHSLYNYVLPWLIAVVCVLGITQFLITWLAYELFQEFGWKIYKKIGADPNMKKMYRAFQIYVVLIKVDFFFFVGFSIQFIYLTLAKRTEDPEYWITIVVLPATFLILWLAIYAVRHESRRWMAVLFFTLICGVAYFIFKVIRMYKGPKIPNYFGVSKFLTLFASLCMITILLTIANAVVCFRNFGRGLKPHLLNDGRESTNATSNTPGRQLEID
ncbi:hypothetical protein BGZ49_001210 [Haplosporangium sp. Z 27]|nr:hypothetical protein BGZ49_001210 [Haplosporangium sp. Z 27]